MGEKCNVKGSIWPKKGWNPGVRPSRAHSVHKPILASGLTLENGQGSSTLWRGRGERGFKTPAAACSGGWDGVVDRAPKGVRRAQTQAHSLRPPGLCFLTYTVRAAPLPLLTSQTYCKEPTRRTRLFRPLEHSKDIIFYSEWAGSHWRSLSRGEKQSDLDFNRRFWMLCGK